MRNLLEETLAVLGRHGLTPEQVLVVHSKDGNYICTWDQFAELAKTFDYDGGFGAAHVPTDLVINCGSCWFDRGEYDGSEWWEHHASPILTPKHTITTLGDNGNMWETLHWLA